MQKTFSEHSHYLGIVKRILKASFVGWETYKDKKSLKVKVQGKTFSLPLVGEEINHETYSHLIKELLNKEDGEGK